MSGSEARTYPPTSWVADHSGAYGLPPTDGTSHFLPPGTLYSSDMRSLPTNRLTAAPPDYGNVSKPYVKEIARSIVQIFPMAFLLFSAALFVMPIYLVLLIGGDINVRKWFPHISFFVCVLPILYLITFFAHHVTKRPSRILITLTLVGSCVLLLVISDVFLFEAYHKAPMFASTTDCMSWKEKRELQQQWKLAHNFYTACLGNKTQKTQSAATKLVPEHRIQDCPNYDKEMKAHPDWAYLEALEATQHCAGWCNEEEPMWTRSKVKDACSPVVAQILKDKVQPLMKKVCFYSVFTLLVISVVLIAAQPLLHKYGFVW